mmetsp:Transcript_140708/g.350794  ORF Transcript_140708/g.350794 Transcript_140708/m.350794 type:complete len:248 (+) Transcript_140708:4088-4831(+)
MSLDASLALPFVRRFEGEPHPHTRLWIRVGDLLYPPQSEADVADGDVVSLHHGGEDVREGLQEPLLHVLDDNDVGPCLLHLILEVDGAPHPVFDRGVHLVGNSDVQTPPSKIHSRNNEEDVHDHPRQSQTSLVIACDEVLCAGLRSQHALAVDVIPSDVLPILPLQHQTLPNSVFLQLAEHVSACSAAAAAAAADVTATSWTGEPRARFRPGPEATFEIAPRDAGRAKSVPPSQARCERLVRQGAAN